MTLADSEANDEWMLQYVHHNMKLQSIYWTYADNRERALKAARATAESEGVRDLRVYRRPKVAPWEPVDWRHEASSEPELAYDRGTEPSGRGRESG